MEFGLGVRQKLLTGEFLTSWALDWSIESLHLIMLTLTNDNSPSSAVNIIRTNGNGGEVMVVRREP